MVWHEAPALPTPPFVSPPLPPLPSPPQCPGLQGPELPSTPPPPTVSLVFQAEELDPEEFLLDPSGQLPGDGAPRGQLPGAGGTGSGQAAASLPRWHSRCGQLCGRAPLPPSEGQARAQGVPGRGGSRGARIRQRHRPPSVGPCLWGKDWWGGAPGQAGEQAQRPISGGRGAAGRKRAKLGAWNLGIYFKGASYNATVSGRLTSPTTNSRSS